MFPARALSCLKKSPNYLSALIQNELGNRAASVALELPVMGWGFRRSLKLGPLKLNLSKSGVGYSIGGRGFRVGQDAKGRSYTSASIPGTGLYSRTYLTPPTAQPGSQIHPQITTTAQQGRGMGLVLLFGAGVLVGMALMGIFSSPSAPPPIAPQPQPALTAPVAPPTQHPAKRRSHRKPAGGSGQASAPTTQSPTE